MFSVLIVLKKEIFNIKIMMRHLKNLNLNKIKASFLHYINKLTL